jgi:predicted TIM-barrel fold metal-dependent hydrolase
MKVFDFNIHLPFIVSDDVNVIINQDMNLNLNEVFEGLELHSGFIESLAGANVLLFNTALFEEKDSGKYFQEKYAATNKDHVFTALIDFRRKDILEYLERVKAAGIKAIMFNSYLQRIADEDFDPVYKACKFAEENKLIICIDGSYGTSKMYQYDNLKLACYIADAVTRVPIVIIHSGGYRIIEAMLLAADKKNVWLDSSFSLPFYIGSSLEKDYAFAYKKLGIDRVVYGSDHPYENSSDALDIHLRFFKDHGFNDGEIEDILFHNAQRLLNFE